MATFDKWEIYFLPHRPLKIRCLQCFNIVSPLKGICPRCKSKNLDLTHDLQKERPVILWHNKSHSCRNTIFGIPLTTKKSPKLLRLPFVEELPAGLIIDPKTDTVVAKPSLVLIFQAGPYDSNRVLGQRRVGVVTDQGICNSIETKLFEWIFP